MRQIGAYAVFVVIAGLLAAAIFLGRNAGQPPSQVDKMMASYNLTSIMASPYRLSVAVNATSSNLTINAVHSQNGSSSGGMKPVTNNLTFKSRNEQVAVVSEGGQVTGVSPGTTTISVSYAEGNVTKTCDVPVTITAAPGT